MKRRVTCIASSATSSRTVDRRARARSPSGPTTAAAPGPPTPTAVLEIRRPEAVAYIVTAPGELGLGARIRDRATWSSHGDVHAALHALLAARSRTCPGASGFAILRGIGPRALRRPPVPPEEVAAAPATWRPPLEGAATPPSISHHYDVSNRFYEIVLGPSMAYTCAVLPLPRTPPSRRPRPRSSTSSAASSAWSPASGCSTSAAGWGGMVMHAAEHYGVEALGVTLSQPQAEWAQRAIAERGLQRARRGSLPRLPRRRRVRLRRRLLDRPHRAHRRSQPAGSYFRFLAAKLRPEGRMLNHTITRPDEPRSPASRASSSTATSSRTANWRAPARSSRRCTTTASRCVTRRTSASTMR